MRFLAAKHKLASTQKIHEIIMSSYIQILKKDHISAPMKEIHDTDRDQQRYPPVADQTLISESWVIRSLARDLASHSSSHSSSSPAASLPRTSPIFPPCFSCPLASWCGALPSGVLGYLRFGEGGITGDRMIRPCHGLELGVCVSVKVA